MALDDVILVLTLELLFGLDTLDVEYRGPLDTEYLALNSNTFLLLKWILQMESHVGIVGQVIEPKNVMNPSTRPLSKPIRRNSMTVAMLVVAREEN